MDLERINIALRPRSDWEAVDLGLRLAQRHASLVFPMWFAASAPWVLVIGAVCIALGEAGLAILLLWWIKPLFERVLLHLYGRLIFDDQPSRADLLRIAWRQPFTAGWLRALTYRRFELARSFNLPVWQLEMLRGEARRKRTSVLHLGSGGTGVVLSGASLALVGLFYTTLSLLVLSFLVHEVQVVDPYSLGEFVGAMIRHYDNAGTGWDIGMFGVYWLCEGFVAPYYVGAGFSLYLNRRTKLEAWDIEMQFRRALRRRGITAALVIGVLAMGALHPGWQSVAHAQDATPATERELIREQIETIVADRDFGQWETRIRWVPKNATDAEEETLAEASDRHPLGWLGSLVGSLTELILWSALILGLGLLIAYRDRWLKYFTGSAVSANASPGARVSVLLDDDALPDDLPAKVAALWRAGHTTDASSLLYRGTLTLLDRRHNLRIEASATEGDCVRRVRRAADHALADYFARITRNWQSIAYAHAQPTDETVLALCEQWPLHMGPPA